MNYTLRPYQIKGIEDIRAKYRQGFKSVLYVSPCASGKCLGKDTPVLMYDGTIKKVQDIKQNDLLMGPDSKPRKVLKTSSGFEQMYKIIPFRNESFICNKSHILSLKLTPTHKNERLKGGNGLYYYDNDIVNISIMDYIKSSKTFKSRAKLYKTKIYFKKNWIHNLIEPYFLGLWLGDGHSRIPSITTMDKEVIKYIYNYSEKYKCQIRIDRAGGKSNTYHITTKHSGLGQNPIKEALSSLSLIKNKHIPYYYLINSEQNRLELLAGLIDTDGYYSGRNYEYSTKLKILKENILFLCRSLGFTASYKEKIIKGKIYYRIYIGGEIHRIPCKIKRKQAKPKKQVRDVLRYGFKVEKLNIDEYFGFEISGPNRLFCLGDFTVTHNTVLFSHIVEQTVKKKKTVMILVNRNTLLKQTSNKLKDAGIRHGIISAKYPEIRYSVQVASVQTMVKRLNRWPHIDLIINDEAHNSSCNTWSKILDHFSDSHILGVTASPCRLDNKGLGNYYQTMIIGPSVRHLVDKGYLSQPIVYASKEIDLKGVRKTGGDYNKKDLYNRMNNHITGCAVNHYKKICPGEPVIAFCVSISHAEKVAAQFRQAGFRSYAIHSKLDSNIIDRYIKMLGNRQIDVLTACDIISEGVDIPILRGAILLRPTQSLRLFIQFVGRAMRIYPGKPNAIILDHANNCERFGILPTTPIDWKLTKDKINIKNLTKKATRCPICWTVFEGLKCPGCGYLIKKKKSKLRIPEQKDGELKIINREEVEKRMKDANTLQDYHDIAEAAGYKPGWAFYSWKRKTRKHMSHPKSYTLFKRPTKKHGIFIYYVQFRDENGNRTTAMSTGETTKELAQIWVNELLKKGDSIC